MPKIDPRVLVASWSAASHLYQVNKHNVLVELGKEAVDIFQGSFDKKGFNSNGEPHWTPWLGAHKSTSLLEETGALRNSIKVKSIKNNKLTVFTDPRAFRTKPKRHKNFCYAAVHNDLGDESIPTPKKGPKVRRQFMGHSSYMDDKFKEVAPKFFKGLPI